MTEASLVGGRIFAQYLQDAYSRRARLDLNGKALYDVKLPGFGQATGFFGDVEDTETFFAYTDFLTPTRSRAWTSRAARSALFRAPKVAIDTERVRHRAGVLSRARTARACRCSSPASAIW